MTNLFSSLFCQQLVTRMLDVEPGNRPTSREVLLHPWMTSKHVNTKALLHGEDTTNVKVRNSSTDNAFNQTDGGIFKFRCGSSGYLRDSWLLEGSSNFPSGTVQFFPASLSYAIPLPRSVASWTYGAVISRIECWKLVKPRSERLRCYLTQTSRQMSVIMPCSRYEH